jgi:hypothetical protein
MKRRAERASLDIVLFTHNASNIETLGWLRRKRFGVRRHRIHGHVYIGGRQKAA